MDVRVRSWRAVVPLASAVLALGALGCQGEGDDGASGGLSTASQAPADGATASFSGEGYSFSYPSAWGESEVREEGGVEGGYSSIVHVVPATGGTTEGLSVAVFRLPYRVGEEDLDQEAKTVATGALQGYERILKGPSTTTVGGLPALTLLAAGTNPAGDEVVAQITYAFDGMTAYSFECQYAPARKAEFAPGCKLALDSFSVD